ncbi:hypothetical protein BEI59_30015 [Eisenbergiella tayi]|uniref:Transposase IS110-like N-terminal domain-containing protein n=2 Tax=Eisenbergiella tayi TaxID=1432052 RepID=A0A1E3U8Y1_9FIRM|nr:hypothetical protein BEI59_30015 [Eisenbergiella tayi]
MISFQSFALAWTSVSATTSLLLSTLNSNRLINMQHVPNATRGVEVIEFMILAVLEGHSQFKYLLIAMESTSFYGVHLANYFSTSDGLKPYELKVFCLNPKEVPNYKKSFSGLGKNDGLDSFIDADFVRVGRISIELWRGSPDSAGTSVSPLPERITMS